MQVLHTDSKYNKDKILKYLICEHYLLNNADSFRIFLRIQHIHCSLGISLVKSSGPLSNPVTFKTQGESFNMSKLVQETLLKPDLIKNIVPSLLNEIKAELISELKSAIRSTVAEAIEEVVNPLRQLINEHQNKIKSLENENNQLKEHVKSSIASVEARYEKFRNVTNNTDTFIADNKKLKADNLKLIHEVSQLNGNIEELEQYGRRTSLRFHNVPMVQGDLQKTDQLIVDIVNKKLKSLHHFVLMI